MISRRSAGKLTSLAITATLPIGLAGVADAAPINWISDGTTFSGSYGDTAHWDAVPPAVPTASDDAIFNNNQATAYTVTLDTNRTVGTLAVQTDNLILDVGTHKITYGTGAFASGASLTSDVTITSSAATSKGSAAGTAALNIGVGASASGSLTITDGATLSISSGNPAIGSGNGANGALTVSNGGVATVVGSSIFVSQSGAQADVTIESGGSLTTSGHFYFAATGAGTVNAIVDDATWHHSHSGRHVNVGSTSTSGGAATVNVTIRNGGSASTTATTGYLYNDGTPSRSFGKDVNYLVTGEGSSMRSGFHYIGGGSTSPVESDHDVIVADGATLGVQTFLKIWQAANSNGGTVFGDDGVLTLNNGFIDVKGGTPGATPITPGAVIVQGKLRGTGTIQRQTGSGPDPFSMTVAASGELRPGDLLDNTPAIGTLTVTEGNVTFGDDGTYFVDVNALGQSDLLNITGNLDLSSLLDTLTVTGTAGGQTYTIAQYSGTLTGQFNSVSLPVGYSVDYGTGSNSAITLVVPEPASLGLLGLGGMLLLTRRRRSKLRV